MAGKPSLMQVSENRGGSSVTSVSSSNSPSRIMDPANWLCVCVCVCVIKFLKGVKTGEL